MKKLIVASAILGVVVQGFAHDLWLVKDEKNAKMYFGHWDSGKIEKGEKFKNIEAQTILPEGMSSNVVKNDDNINITLAKKGDVAVVNVREPKKSKLNNAMNKRVMTMRAGRETTSALSDLDIAPKEANSNTFTVMYKGAPLAKTEIKVYSPTKWMKSFRTDDNGIVTIETPWQGEYFVKIEHDDKTAGISNGVAYESTIYVTTVTFDVNNGLPWGKPMKK